MKKILLVVSLIAVLLLAGCNKEEKINNNIEEGMNNGQQEVMENSEENSNRSTTAEDLVGTFSWNENDTSDNGFDLKVELVLKSDGSAEYSASDGFSAEKTRGTFEYQDGKIIYTREYYNYNGVNGQDENSKFDDENNMVETFDVIDANTLQGSYHDQTAILNKVNQSSLSPYYNFVNNLDENSNVSYTDEQLINMVKVYREAKGLYVPEFIEIDGEEENIVTIHLYEIVDNHAATSDWYYISRLTGKGTNFLGEEIDLNESGTLSNY